MILVMIIDAIIMTRITNNSNNFISKDIVFIGHEHYALKLG